MKNANLLSSGAGKQKPFLRLGHRSDPREAADARAAVLQVAMASVWPKALPWQRPGSTPRTFGNRQWQQRKRKKHHRSHFRKLQVAMTTLIASPAARAAAAKAGLPVSIEESNKDGATLATATRFHDAWQLIRSTCSEVFDLDRPVPLAIGVDRELIDLGAPLDRTTPSDSSARGVAAKYADLRLEILRSVGADRFPNSSVHLVGDAQ